MTGEMKTILEAATWAPSGENCQPWRFRIVSEKEFQLLNNPESDQSLYNVDQCASLVACGAALENMIIAASGVGCRLEYQLFPDHSNPNLVSTIVIVPDPGLEKDDLIAVIPQRTTNRKPYQLGKKLSATEKSALQTTDAGAKIVLLEEDNERKRAADHISMSERILFENKMLHQFFFSHINWTEAEDRRKKVGFYLPTLELPAPAKMMFNVFRHWPLLNFFNRLGASHKVATENAKTYFASSELGAITVPGFTPADFVLAGRTFERLWLRATQLGLSLQPMTGVLFFHQRIRVGKAENFSLTHRELIEKAFTELQEVFRVGQTENLVLVFRLGYASAPSARSSKFSLEEVMLQP